MKGSHRRAVGWLLFFAVLVGAQGVTQPTQSPVIWHVEDFEQGANVVPGTTDETPYFAAAIAKALTTNGWVQLQLRSYYTASSWSIPRQTAVRGGFAPGQKNVHPDVLLPLITLGAGATINIAGGAEGFSVIEQGVLLNPATLQAGIANTAAYAGTAITLQGPARLEHLILLGFATAVNTNSQANWHMDDIQADALSCYNFTGVQNYSYASNLWCFPWIAPATGNTGVTTSIAAVGDNGAGLIRITTSAAHGFITGNQVLIYGSSVGYVGALERWNITVIDSTHFDLATLADGNFPANTPSASTPTVTATTTAGSNVISVSSVANLAVGQTFIGANISGTQTITAVSQPLSEIQIANGSNVTGSGVTTLSVANPVYAANSATAAVLYVNRPGPCLTVTNSAAASITNLSCWGQDTALLFGNGAQWTNIFNFSTEGPNHADDPSTIGIVFSGSSGGNFVYLGYIDAYHTDILQNSSATGPKNTNKVINGLLNAYGQTGSVAGNAGIDVRSGNLELDATTCNTDTFYVASGAYLRLTGDDCTAAAFNLGSSLTDVTMANSTFGDIPGNTVRGSSVSLVVPNAAGSAYQAALTANANGVQFNTPPWTVATLPACNSGNRGLKTAVYDAAATPTYFGVPTGSGNIYATVLCTGASWVYN